MHVAQSLTFSLCKNYQLTRKKNSACFQLFSKRKTHSSSYSRIEEDNKSKRKKTANKKTCQQNVKEKQCVMVLVCNPSTQETGGRITTAKPHLREGQWDGSASEEKCLLASWTAWVQSIPGAQDTKRELNNRLPWCLWSPHIHTMVLCGSTHINMHVLNFKKHNFKTDPIQNKETKSFKQTTTTKKGGLKWAVSHKSTQKINIKCKRLGSPLFYFNTKSVHMQTNK